MNTQRFHSVRTVSFAMLALSAGPLALSQTSASSYPPPSSSNPPPPTSSAGQRAGAAISNAADAMSKGVANVSRKIENVATSLRTASADEQDHATDKLIGRKVQDGQGNELGQVKDFLIDPQSGQIRFAVVSGGGLFGVGDTSHLIPFSSLQSAGNHYTASLSKAEWSQLPPVTPNPSGAVIATAETQIGSSTPANGMAANTSQLIRATALRGQSVRSGTSTLGTIDTIIIDPNTSRAEALLKPSSDVAATTQEIVLPWSRLNLSGGAGGTISTSLTKAEVQAAAPENSQYAAQERANSAYGNYGASAPVGSPMNSTARDSSRYGSDIASSTPSSANQTTPEAEGMARENNASGITPSPSDRFAQGAVSPRATEPYANGSTSNSSAQVDQNLSPTGQTSADQNPYADPKLLSAARAVRQALDGDPTVARADVRVVPQNGRLVLSGNVDTPALRSTVERLATQSAQGVAIDDQVKVNQDQ